MSNGLILKLVLRNTGASRRGCASPGSIHRPSSWNPGGGRIQGLHFSTKRTQPFFLGAMGKSCAPSIGFAVLLARALNVCSSSSVHRDLENRRFFALAFGRAS